MNEKSSSVVKHVASDPEKKQQHSHRKPRSKVAFDTADSDRREWRSPIPQLLDYNRSIPAGYAVVAELADAPA
jgi:hypothetical protein